MNNIQLSDVTIHVDEELGMDQRAVMETGLRAMDGVVSVHSRMNARICCWLSMTRNRPVPLPCSVRFPLVAWMPT